MGVHKVSKQNCKAKLDLFDVKNKFNLFDPTNKHGVPLSYLK